MRTILRLPLLPFAALAFVLGAGPKPVKPATSPRRRARFARRAVPIAGSTALLAGIALLSLAAYTYLGSGGQGSSGTVGLVYRDDPGGIYDLPANEQAVALSAAATPAPAPAPVVAVRPPPLRDRPFRMVIEKIGVDAGVFTYGLDENRVPQVPLNPWDIAWYDFSSRPGTGGNAVFAGHVTWNGRAVFYNLDQVAAGDVIKLAGEDGTQLSYIVTDAYLVDPNDPAALSVMGAAGDDVITIVTCGGTFFRTGDPVFGGDYTNRLVVRAVLSETVLPPALAAASGG